MIVNSAPDSRGATKALGRLCEEYPDASMWTQPGTDLRGLLADAIADSPIRQSHELLVARIDARDNGIRLDTARLFAEGARRGAVAELAIRSEYVDSHGTIFAVVAWAGRTPRLLSADSARLLPGLHQVRAELLRPGKVLFTEPPNVVTDPRGLSELINSIPRSLNAVSQAHLICAIEVAGSPVHVAARLYRAEKVIEAVHRQMREPGRLEVGLLAYGTHRFDRHRSDDRVTVTQWRSAPDSARKALGWLGAIELGDSPAAQIEDTLAEIVRRLGAQPNTHHTALVLFGDRPPHPADSNGIVKPCPKGHDWRKLLAILKSRPDFTITTIRDELTAPGVSEWTDLDDKPEIPLSLETINADTLATRMNLITPILQQIPIPVIHTE